MSDCAAHLVDEVLPRVRTMQAVQEQAFELADQRPLHTELVLYPQPLLEAMGPQIAEALKANPDPDIVAEPAKYLPLLDLLAQESERVVLSVANTARSGDLFVRVYPRSGTSLAALRDNLRPADHALVTKLPPLDPSSLVSGELRPGPASEFLLAQTARHLAANYPRREAAARWLELLGPLAESLDGRFVWATQAAFDGPDLVHICGLLGVRDEALARAAIDALLDAFSGRFKVGKTRTSARYERDVVTHEGVSFNRYDTGLNEKLADKLVEGYSYVYAQTHDLAVFDGFAALGPVRSAGDSVDSVRGGAHLELDEALEHVIANSKALKESVLLWTNIHNILGYDARDTPPLVYGLGRQGDALSFRLSALRWSPARR